jgi:cellulose synthase/poly-beta-1,6-N-acetylglucosamine synthase-like glycosyltransferase
MSEEDWRRYGMIPVNATNDTIVVAVEDPFNHEGRLHLSACTDKPVRSIITGRRDIERTLAERYEEQNLIQSRDDLKARHPDDSAHQTITRPQVIALAAVAFLILVFMIWHPVTTLAVLSSLLIAAYAALVAYRLWIIRDGTRVPSGISADQADIEALDDTSLPIYTILIPARDEARVLSVLTQSLIRLDYPKDRLDVKLILEADDESTIEAARRAHLPSIIDLVIVPAGEPRTKPKACNFALQRARGEFITIFDAEDAPEPTQLKKAVLAFQNGDPSMVCVQAKLSYFNASQNLLTRWFTAEYAAWFDLFLPALHAAHLPIPLGGTSNHFRTAMLRKLGAWDPFNVTEDADLGVRIFKAGYTTSVIDSVTYEEANSDFVNWIRQRSRWIKGYLQTWLVHMRHPLQLYRQLGGWGFWGFQMSILGTPLMFLLNPLYWFLTSLWFMTHWNIIPNLFPPGIYYLGMMNLLVGNFTFMYLNAIGAAKRGSWELIPYTLMIPIYWSMMSLASWKALLSSLPGHHIGKRLSTDW